ncbi:MAG: MATE family efflux transporter [Proteobacteria bacterium]|nr:MATE family efflux transporter [Pseudomonadota bacterium]MCP4915942.1 MATE family efflux transporter [Pseudomonadota bacterium]
MPSSVPKRLLDLALPVIGLNVLNVLALFVDTAMVGRIPGQADAALTGLGFAVSVIFLLFVAMLGLTVGSVAFVSRAHGAGHDERVTHILHQSTQLTVLLGVGMALAGNAVAPWVLTWMGASGEAHTLALDYLRPLLACTTFNYLNVLYAGVLRGVGNTRLAFGVALGMNALNVVLNYGLILGNYGLPAMGVTGAAIGTCIAQFAAMLAMVSFIRAGKVPRVDLPLRVAKIDVPLARDLIRVGTPAALDMLVLNASFLSIIGMLSRIDQIAVAAHGIGLRIQALSFVPGMSISQAAAAMVGQALGAGDPDEARRIVRWTAAMCFCLMSALALGIWGLDEPILALFEVEADSPVGQSAVIWIAMLALCMPPVGFWLGYGAAFMGSGSTRTSLIINALATFAFQIPASYFMGFVLDWGVLGVWAGFPVAFLVKAIVGTLAYRYTGWARAGAAA